jgi:hypothetical protein
VAETQRSENAQRARNRRVTFDAVGQRQSATHVVVEVHGGVVHGNFDGVGGVRRAVRVRVRGLTVDVLVVTVPLAQT